MIYFVRSTLPVLRRSSFDYAPVANDTQRKTLRTDQAEFDSASKLVLATEATEVVRRTRIKMWHRDFLAR